MEEIRFGLLVAAACLACTRPTAQCVCGPHEPAVHRPFGVRSV